LNNWQIELQKFLVVAVALLAVAHADVSHLSGYNYAPVSIPLPAPLPVKVAPAPAPVNTYIPPARLTQ